MPRGQAIREWWAALTPAERSEFVAKREAAIKQSHRKRTTRGFSWKEQRP